MPASPLAMGCLLLALAGCASAPVLAPGEERVAPGEAAVAAELSALVREVTRARSRERGGPVLRFNQVKTLGCLAGRLEVPALPPELAQGVFAAAAVRPVYLRFANASEHDDREPDLRGLSLVVRDPSGGREQHFLFNSHPVLFAATPEEFLGFVRAGAEGSLAWWFLNPFDSHLGAMWTLLQARQRHASVFDIPYFGVTPARFGADPRVAVKHSLRPCATRRSPGEPGDSPHYLRRRMAEHLAQAPACFDFMVQFQGDPAEMPVEDASVAWSETASPPRRVGRVLLEDQPWQEAAALARCERAVFDPWTGLPAHRPLGGINRVRRTVYPAAASFRQEANGW